MLKKGWIVGALTLTGAILGMAAALNHAELGAFFSDLTESRAPELRKPTVTSNIAHPRAAPRFELPQADSSVFKLESLKGNVVMVHFWASWCAPCLGELPKWIEFAGKQKGKAIRFVAVSLDQGWPQANKILSKVPDNVISVLDAEQKLPDLFGTYQYPETYLLDRELRIVSKWIGAQEWESLAVAQAIEELLR